MFSRTLTVLLVALVFPCRHAGAWGFWAHQRINHYACFTLPPELFPFYKANIAFVTDHAVDPDRRRYSDPAEAPRHFIDIDHYGRVEAIPVAYDEAACLYSEDTLQAHGIVPWAIAEFYFRLVKAFTEKDGDRILYYSACLGHYIGDAHVPLHCTHNYNGQLTGQKGIHGFWESRLPELFGDDFDYIQERCVYVEHPLLHAWSVIRESAAAVDSVLVFERELDRVSPPDSKYTLEERGRTMVRAYSRDYSARYNAMLDGQVERRLACAIRCVGDFWYSAWVDAGQPVLDGMHHAIVLSDSAVDQLQPPVWLMENREE